MNKKTTFIKGALLTLSSFMCLNLEAQLGEYAFFGGGACPHNNAYLAVTTQPLNATFSLYSTTGTTCATTSNQYGNTDWETGSTVNLNQYNEFTITPDNGYVINLDSISFGHQVNSTPCNWHLRSSIDNFSSDIFSGQTTDSWEYPIYLFSGLTNISSAVTFRFYVTNIDANTTRWRQDNVTIYGTITQSSTPSTWYADVDNDAYGDPLNSELAVTSTLPNAKLVAGDCNDNNSAINPSATDIPDNGIDEDCSGLDATTASIYEISNDVKIYPNPVMDELSILSLKVGDLIKVYAMDGTLVLSSKLKDSKVNVASLADGTYQLVLFEHNTKIANIVFVKK